MKYRLRMTANDVHLLGIDIIYRCESWVVWNIIECIFYYYILKHIEVYMCVLIGNVMEIISYRCRWIRLRISLMQLYQKSRVILPGKTAFVLLHDRHFWSRMHSRYEYTKRKSQWRTHSHSVVTSEIRVAIFV